LTPFVIHTYDSQLPNLQTQSKKEASSLLPQDSQEQRQDLEDQFIEFGHGNRSSRFPTIILNNMNDDSRENIYR
jgi:hypothetical protein